MIKTICNEEGLLARDCPHYSHEMGTQEAICKDKKSAYIQDDIKRRFHALLDGQGGPYSKYQILDHDPRLDEQGYSTELEGDKDAEGRIMSTYPREEDLDALERMFFDEDATPATDNIYTVTRKTTWLEIVRSLERSLATPAPRNTIWLETCNIYNEEGHLHSNEEGHLQRDSICNEIVLPQPRDYPQPRKTTCNICNEEDHLGRDCPQH
ncbi:hypothetical protein CLAIMM_14322 [Cladophialophora immunda]|nr:hypothetical protein CLAIMM_14322 [Cladophialophora immunda]